MIKRITIIFALIIILAGCESINKSNIHPITFDSISEKRDIYDFKNGIYYYGGQIVLSV